MQFKDTRNCCQNCEHLRIDNFCLAKGKYILSKNTSKTRDCSLFSNKIIQAEDELKENKVTNAKKMTEILLQVQNNSETKSKKRDSIES